VDGKPAVKSDLLLFLASAIWGFSFVAQRAGMQFIGPFSFNAIRFALGAALIGTVTLLTGKNRTGQRTVPGPGEAPGAAVSPIPGGVLAGTILFLGASLQQIGIVYTTAGKAGFITGLYVVLVPILGLFLGAMPSIANWFGALLAASGLYLLSFRGTFSIEPGDGLVLLGALFWAVHVLVIGRYSNLIDPFKLAFLQFATCSILSASVAVFMESTSTSMVQDATWPILYSGFLSVGVAFTLQVFAQRKAHPSHAAIILSMETVFAAIGGWIILNESIPARGLLGCTLMLAGIIVSQVFHVRTLKKSSST